MDFKFIDDDQKRVYETAIDLARKGPGYAQQAIVMMELRKKFDVRHEPEREQVLLTRWHDLFRRGVLSWGFDLENAGPPFFHVADADATKVG